MDGDSPLSIASNIVGLLTFVVAVVLGIYARALSLKAALNYRDDILKAIIDTLEAFSDTSILADSPQIPGVPVFAHTTDDLLREMFTDLFELMNIFFVLALNDKRLSVMSNWRRDRIKWQSRLDDLRGRIARAQQTQLLASLHFNLQKNLESQIDKISTDLVEWRLRFGEHQGHARRYHADPHDPRTSESLAETVDSSLRIEGRTSRHDQDSLPSSSGPFDSLRRNPGQNCAQGPRVITPNEDGGSSQREAGIHASSRNAPQNTSDPRSICIMVQAWEALKHGEWEECKMRIRRLQPKIGLPNAAIQHEHVLFCLSTIISITQPGRIWLHHAVQEIDPSHPSSGTGHLTELVSLFRGQKKSRSWISRLWNRLKIFDYMADYNETWRALLPSVFQVYVVILWSVRMLLSLQTRTFERESEVFMQVVEEVVPVLQGRTSEQSFNWRRLKRIIQDQ